MFGRIIFIILLLVSVFVEVTILPFPFFVLFAILFFLFWQDTATFFVILLLSLLFDRLLIHTLGTTALFLFLFFCVAILLEKLFTLKINFWIGIGITVLGIEIYRQFIGYPFLWGIEIIMVISLILLALIDKKTNRKERGLRAAQKI